MGATSDGGVTILVSLHRFFFFFRQIPIRLGIIALNSSLCNGKLSVFGSSDSVNSRFLARNLSGLTRWCSCLYELVLRSADGAGLSVVRCCSISFARSPSAKSCFQRQANFKRWSTGSFHFDSRVHWRQNPIARQSKIFVPILLTGKDQVTMGMTPFY